MMLNLTSERGFAMPDKVTSSEHGKGEQRGTIRYSLRGHWKRARPPYRDFAASRRAVCGKSARPIR